MAAIRAAYRNLMRRFHPDVNRSDDAAARATAINEAYVCLSDEGRRAAYDEGRVTRETIYQPRAASRPRRSPRPDWSEYPAFSPIPEPEPQPIPVRFAILGLADEARARNFDRLTVIWDRGAKGPEEFFLHVGFTPIGETPYGEVLGAMELQQQA